MKQKIVIKVQVTCKKYQSKAMTIAAKTNGVISVAIGGAEHDEVVVIGDGVDAACLSISLSKKLKYAKLLTVENVQEEESESPEETDMTSCVETTPYFYPQSYCQSYPAYPTYPVVYPRPTNACNIM